VSFGELARLERRIDALFRDAQGLGIDLQAELAKLACILASGYLEVACEEIFSAYTEPRSNGSVGRYVNRHLRRLRNVKSERLLQLVGAFDPERRSEVEEEIRGRLADSINSIVANRNLVAHGRDVGLTLVRVKQYYDDAREAMRHVRAHFPGRT